MADEKPPLLLPREALAFFRAKGFAIGFDWRDIWQEEHARAFTVAKAMTRDLLEDIRAALDDALENGKTLAQFRQDLSPLLFARGWWGKSLQTDPLTGEEKVVQLGSPRRLRVIYDTNMRSAYAAGRWERVQRQKKVFPYLIYTSVLDGREREQHHAWHGTVLPVDHPWWDTHFPPCDWGCRCTARPANQRMLDRRGQKVTEPVRFPDRTYVNKRTGEITRVEKGIGPGFSFNIGKAYLDPLTPTPLGGSAQEGEDGAASDLSGTEKKALTVLFAPFGFADGRSLLRGRIWRDAQGWPMAIGAGMFRTIGGRLDLPKGKGRSDAIAALQALADPDSIRLVWISDKSGRAVLARRYIRTGTAVFEVSRLGWRAARGRTDRFEARGQAVWQRP